ncbi:MAG TPA: hypothetical protein PLH11_06820 [Gemmobacter sp.]|nr:hypothetical protein [Gemmobacter sp.]
MSKTLAPTAVGIFEESLVITPAGTRVTSRSVNLAGEGDPIPGCTTTGTDGIAVCRSFQPLVMFVGGALDVKFRPMIRGFEDYDRVNESKQDIGYVSWNRDAALFAIALHWRAQGQKIVLIGHSMGGAKAHAVSKRLSDAGHDVELLVTLDPVFNRGAQPKPARVKTWRNIHVDYARAAGSTTSPNGIARLGGPWQNCPGADTNVVFWDIGQDAHAKAEEMFEYFRSEVEAVI